MSLNARGWGAGGVSAKEYSGAHGAQINFGNLTLFLSYGFKTDLRKCPSSVLITPFSSQIVFRYTPPGIDSTRAGYRFHTWPNIFSSKSA